MRAGPSPSQQLRITHWDEGGAFHLDMSWDDWDELAKDVEYFRKHGRPRPGSDLRVSPTTGNDMDGKGLWVPGHVRPT